MRWVVWVLWEQGTTEPDMGSKTFHPAKEQALILVPHPERPPYGRPPTE